MTGEARQLDGQDWRIVTEIGHSLQPQDRKSVGRVMSMDPGVGNNLDIIVATAALEVGFNDPRVGAVLQHKAPRDVAQFLQRKVVRAARGRCGHGPLRYCQIMAATVLRIKAMTFCSIPNCRRDRFRPTTATFCVCRPVYASLDYLSLAAGHDRASVWQDLAMPGDRMDARDRQRRLSRALRRILNSPGEQDRYLDS